MRDEKRIARKTKTVCGGGQILLKLGEVGAESVTARTTPIATGVVFKDPDPRTLFVGDQRLDEFINQMGFTRIFRLREILRSLDLTAFEAKYKAGGRQPYHPAGMLGLILFGIMEGRNSLRELETLGRSDVRTWWLTGGVMPNYSVICRFINRNTDVLTEEFFEQLTRQILRRTSSTGKRVAIDGTVIQAAASRYRTIKQEAAKQAAQEARRKADQNSSDQKLAARAEQSERVAEVAKERSAEREKKKRKNQDAPVCPSEPDAVVQQLKTKAFAPGYKGSVAANDDRIITAKAVHPTSETAVVPGLVDQTERVANERVSELMDDAGYHCKALLAHAVEHDINLLCPSGRADGGEESWERKSDKFFPKYKFRFDEANDVYICPKGQRLERDHVYRGNAQNPAYTQYRCVVCCDCPLRKRCTRSAYRSVRRYAEDELREAMRMVMKQPQARQRYRQRQAMVEPVHGEIKYIQNLMRFRRRGLKKVSLEYSLHCAAHNLRRYVRLCGPSAAANGRHMLNTAQSWLAHAAFHAKSLMTTIGVNGRSENTCRHVPMLQAA